MPPMTATAKAPSKTLPSSRKQLHHKPGATHAPRFYAQGVWPGLFLTGTIAGLAFAARQIPGVATFSPMILAIVIGMVFHNIVGTPKRAKDGVIFSLRRILRFAIILLGLQLTAEQVLEVGPRGMAIIAVTLLGTFAFTTWLGRMMGVNHKLTQLIAAGTSICGASAVIATNTVTKGHDEDVAYAVACVTVFGSIAMFAYPLLPGLLHLDAHAYGLWTGASIHEIAQVVAASFQGGQSSGEFGTIAKLSRVMMLAPMVIGLGLMAARHSKANGDKAADKVPMPWFLVAFLVLVAVNSVITIPPAAKAIVVTVTTVLLTMSLAAMGLETDIAKLAAKGLKPLILGAAASLFIAGLSLALIKLAT